jgi:hypothetical protein
MDVCELIIVIERAKCLKNENVNLDAKLWYHVNDLKKFTETIECLQLSVLELSYHAPISQEQLEDLHT